MPVKSIQRTRRLSFIVTPFLLTRTKQGPKKATPPPSMGTDTPPTPDCGWHSLGGQKLVVFAKSCLIWRVPLSVAKEDGCKQRYSLWWKPNIRQHLRRQTVCSQALYSIPPHLSGAGGCSIRSQVRNWFSELKMLWMHKVYRTKRGRTKKLLPLYNNYLLV